VPIASPANVDVTQRLLHLPEPSIQLQVLGRSSDADDVPRGRGRCRAFPRCYRNAIRRTAFRTIRPPSCR
jgi:hypothetical protein